MRTEGEWDALEQHVKSLGKRDINRFVNSKTYDLIKRFKECNKCISSCEGEKKKKWFYIDEESYKTLEEMESVIKKPIGAIINELVITPILLPK